MRLLLFIAVISLGSCSSLPQKYADSKAPWEAEVDQLLARDQTESYPDDAILFVGSSSIRLWKTITEDMAPYVPIQRGYGGARFSDLIHFTDRIVSPHKVQAVACFVANDIAGDTQRDVAPKEVLRLFKYFVKQVRAIHPDVPIFQIAITPTPSRWKVYDQTAEANRLMAEYCAKTPNLFFIDTTDAYLTAEGQPRPELFLGDMLHQNRAGYDLWKELIKKSLDTHLAR